MCEVQYSNCLVVPMDLAPVYCSDVSSGISELRLALIFFRLPSSCLSADAFLIYFAEGFPALASTRAANFGANGQLNGKCVV